MQRLKWIDSGIVEELDARQIRLVELVLSQIERYYRDLFETRDCFRYPLNLRRLAKMCRRSNSAVLGAVRILAHTIPEGIPEEPKVFYDRISSQKNASHRAYRIFLRRPR